MPPSRPIPRNPTEKAAALREAMAALLATGSLRKAAALTGISYRTIGAWANSEEGKRAQADIREKESAPGGHVERLEGALDKALAIVTEKLNGSAEEISLKDAVIAFGILSDKHARLVGPKQDKQDGPMVFEVVGFSPGAPVIDVKALPSKSRKPPKKSSDEPPDEDDDES